METSAKTGHNITDVFQKVVNEVFEKGGNLLNDRNNTINPNQSRSNNDSCC